MRPSGFVLLTARADLRIPLLARPRVDIKPFKFFLKGGSLVGAVYFFFVFEPLTRPHRLFRKRNKVRGLRQGLPNDLYSIAPVEIHWREVCSVGWAGAALALVLCRHGRL